MSEYESFWMATSDAPTRPPLPPGEHSGDVVVLGAGIAGLTTAYALAKEGRRVTVLEAGQVAAGVTGYTTAKVSVHHSLVYADLASRHGDEAAQNYGHSQSEALAWLRRTVAEEGIDCDLETVRSLVYTESEDEVSTLEQEAEAAQAAGLPATLTRESPLPYPIVAGVAIEGQAQFHPRRYLLHLARRITELGGTIHEQTRAIDVDGTTVRTAGGSIEAQHVVVATHYPFLDRGLLFARLAPYRDVVVAYSVPHNQAPDVVAISTGAEQGGAHSVRTAPLEDGQRLLIVTGGQYKTGSTESVEERYDQLDGWARERFGVGEPTYRWSTQDASSADRLPYIGAMPMSKDGVWVATGFSGWGMTNGTLSGMLLADLIQERTNPWSQLYSPSRVTVRASAKKVLKENTDVAKHLAAGIGRDDIDNAAELASGEWAVFHGSQGRTAAYRDDTGTLHCVSAACTHLGCTVAFNDAERSWDCPCHGSRFGVDGQVLQGPAVEPLAPIEAE